MTQPGPPCFHTWSEPPWTAHPPFGRSPGHSSTASALSCWNVSGLWCPDLCSIPGGHTSPAIGWLWWFLLAKFRIGLEVPKFRPPTILFLHLSIWFKLRGPKRNIRCRFHPVLAARLEVLTRSRSAERSTDRAADEHRLAVVGWGKAPQTLAFVVGSESEVFQIFKWAQSSVGKKV